jgi:hypothetical protein
MEDFNIINEKKNTLDPIIEKLYLLCYTKTTFSQIEKDILLQNLREAYMTILSMQTDECMEKEEDEIRNTEEEAEKTENGMEQSESRIQQQNPDMGKFSEGQPESEKQDAEEKIIEEEVVIKEEKENVIEENIIEEDLIEESVTEGNIIEKSLIEEELIEESITEENPFKEEEIPFVKEDIIEKTESEITPIVNVTSHEIKEIDESVTILPKRSLNDLFTEKREERSLNARFRNEKITDLTKSISINDKFLFIRELFQNKGEEFSRSLHILNHCEDIETAFEEMENMKKNYYWDSTSSAYLKLCDLIRRKF